MEQSFTLPQELQTSFQRIMPYMSARLRNDQQSIEAIALYLKLGGERLARIAIDAYNQTHRLQDAADQKLRLEETLLAKQMENENDDDDDEEEEEGAENNSENDDPDNDGY